jgi:hypothetical protein
MAEKTPKTQDIDNPPPAGSSQTVRVIDNPSIAETYANKLIATSFDVGAVVITLGTTRFLPEPGGQTPKGGSLPPVHVTARLAISPAGAVELTNALNSMLKTLSQIQQKAAAAKSN